MLLPDDLLAVDDDRRIQYGLYPGELKRQGSRTTMPLKSLVALIAREADEMGDVTDALDQTLRFGDDAGTVLGEATILECVTA